MFTHHDISKHKKTLISSIVWVLVSIIVFISIMYMITMYPHDIHPNVAGVVLVLSIFVFLTFVFTAVMSLDAMDSLKNQEPSP